MLQKVYLFEELEENIQNEIVEKAKKQNWLDCTSEESESVYSVEYLNKHFTEEGIVFLKYGAMLIKEE